MNANEHYNEDYFEWQKKMGVVGGRCDKFKFESFVTKNDVVCDFGCGGGYILQQLNCATKIGVEINDSARLVARQNGIEVYPELKYVENGSVDVIISNHALEHVDNPFLVLTEMRAKLKPDGKLVLVVPFERKNVFKEDDINMHLYTWSPQNIGNLCKRAGFNIDDVSELKHTWPPHYDRILKLFGEKWFYRFSYIWAWLRPNISQVRVIASK